MQAKITTEVPGSFGAGFTTMGPDAGFLGKYFDTPRFKKLAFRRSYYTGSQHDWKTYDFDGRPIQAGSMEDAYQPPLTPDVAPYLVPLAMRRPSDPYKLGFAIVNSFTEMILGDGRFPSVTIQGDDEANEFISELIKLQDLPSKMISARDIGGSCGSVGISWCFRNGDIITKAHDPKYIVVHAWKDEERCIPSYVVELYQHEKQVFNYEKKILETVVMWFRRDWTENADIYYEDCPVNGSTVPVFTIDPKKTIVHNDGKCHFVWIKNTDAAELDGLPDYHNIYENMNVLDIMNSEISKGTNANLDPTLLMKVDVEFVKVQGSLKKGSDNALMMDRLDSAEYLELTGSSLSVALTVFQQKRKNALEICSCVIPDPDVIAAQGTSSVALKMMFSRMISSCNVKRTLYGEGIARLLNDQLAIARKYYAAGFKLNIPDGVKEIEEIDPITKEPTGNILLKPYTKVPGMKGTLNLVWGPYFQPTPTDIQSGITAMQTATGGKPVITQRSAVKVVSQMVGLDPEVEYTSLKEQEAAKDDPFQGELDQAAGGFRGLANPGLVGGRENGITGVMPTQEQCMTVKANRFIIQDAYHCAVRVFGGVYKHLGEVHDCSNKEPLDRRVQLEKAFRLAGKCGIEAPRFAKNATFNHMAYWLILKIHDVCKGIINPYTSEPVEPPALQRVS